MNIFVRGFFILCVSIVFNKVEAQVGVRLGNVTRSCGQDTVSMPVSVDNFSNIGAVSFTIAYNPDSLSFLGISYSHPGISSGNLIVNSPIPGRIISSWYSLSPLNILSGDYLHLDFEALLPGSSVVNWDTTESWYNEIADVSTGETVPIDFFHNGTISTIPNSIQPQLFTVDSLFQCGDSLVLDAGTGYSRYEWSSGDTTQIKIARYTGWYRVRVFDGLCPVEDSVYVSLINVHLSSNDSLLCVGTGAELKVLFNNQKSLYFNGNSQFASNNGNYISRDNFTLEIVAKPNASSGSGFLIGPSHGGSYDGGVGIRLNKNAISIIEHGDGYMPTVLTYNFSSPINDFLHIALVYSNKTPYLYINGVLVASGTSSPRQHIFISFNSATVSGQYGGLGGHTYGWFDGWVSKVTVRDLALDTNQIQNVYSQYLSGVFDPNLKEHYSFDGSPMLRANIDPSNSLFFSSNTPTWTDIIPNQTNLSFLWSTGDTTSSITVSPTQTTTYYVTVSNGIHSCVDSVTVTVTDALRIADQFVCIGDTTEIPVLVSKLDDIAAISMAVAFDSTTMDFVGYAHLHPALQSAQIGSLGNQIRLGWFGIQPIDLSNDTLVRLRFVFSGSGSVVFDTSDPANCEIVNDDLDIVPFCFEGGSMSPADPVQIISSPTGPFVLFEHDTVELSVQSIGARVHEWQWFNSNSGQWQSAAGIPGYTGVNSSRIIIEDIAYSRPHTRLRLRLNNGCSDVFSPEFMLEVQQRLRVEVMPAVGCSGDTLEIPVRIWGARELGAISMSLLSLPQSLTYAEWVRVHPSTQAAGWQMAMLNGDIRCSWSSIQSASIADGDTLGVFRLVAVGGTPLIWDAQNPGHNEYADAGGNLIECSYLDAAISTLALPQPQLMASNMAFCPGGSSALWVQEVGGQGQNGWVYEWLKDGQLVFTGNSDSAYVVSVPGLYRVQVTAPNGCRAWTDSLFITASQISSTTLNPVICAPSVFVSGGQPFSSSGTYQLTLVNAVGCDSLITIHLIVNEPSDSTLSVEICSPSSYAFNGQNHSETGVYSATLTNAVGCDSVLILNLTVNQPVSTHLSETICAPSCYQVGGQDFCVSGQYTITLTNSLGCDSVVQLGLTVQNCNRIDGVLRYRNAALTPMSRSRVNLLTQAGVIVATDSTNALGQFQLNGYSSGNYILSGQSSLNWGGVNATDAILIARSYNLVPPLTGLNLLAADVNSSGTVNVTDAVFLTRRYSFNILSLPSGNWCFENLSINATGQPVQQNLMALCFGDVNGSNALMGQRLGSGLSWGDYRSDLMNEGVSSLRFPIYLSGISRMGAMSLAVQLPVGVQLSNARNLMSNGNFSFGQEGSEMRMAWFDVDGFGIHADQPIMEWELSCQDCDWGDVLNRMQILEHSELADELGAVRMGAQLHRPFYSKSVDGQPTRIYVYPNPGSGMFHVNGPAIHLRIRDVSGKELVQLPASGFDTKVDLQHLTDGVYMLEVETLAGMEFHRLVVKK